MRIHVAVAMAAWAALPALAQSPSDFASRAEITTAGSDALQRFALPFEVYRDARADFADVRVFDARGKAVPIAFAAEAEPGPAATPAPRSRITLEAAAGAKSGEFVYDLGAPLPIEAVRLIPRDRNSAVTFSIHARGMESEWMPLATFRMTPDGGAGQAPLEIGRRVAREWMARAEPQAGWVAAVAPRIEVQWHDAQVVFVARGDPPFRLAFGNRDAKGTWMPVSTLVPGYKRGDEMKIAEAEIGAVESGPPESSRRAAWKLTLWALLVIAVAVLGFMAWRLFRRMRAE